MIYEGVGELQEVVYPDTFNGAIDNARAEMVGPYRDSLNIG